MALIPPAYLNSVVSIEVETKNGKGEPVKTSIATGFLLGKKVSENKEGNIGTYRLFLVTNRHVFQNQTTKVFLKEVFLRFNTQDNQSHYFQVGLLKPDNSPFWLMHANEKVDLAVLPINPDVIIKAKIEYHFFKEGELIYAKDFASQNISTGDGLFVLGFPLSISGKSKNFVIVRQGIIARVDEEVLADNFYYIDASAYPGNSGGPVIHKPEVVSIVGTQSNASSMLIGVISSGVTYSDAAISQQTGEPRIVFTEQTGLVKVVPIELVYEIIDVNIKAITSEAKIQATGVESEV